MITDILLGLTLAIIVLVSANILSALNDHGLRLKRVERLLLEVWQELEIDGGDEDRE